MHSSPSSSASSLLSIPETGENAEQMTATANTDTASIDTGTLGTHDADDHHPLLTSQRSGPLTAKEAERLMERFCQATSFRYHEGLDSKYLVFDGDGAEELTAEEKELFRRQIDYLRDMHSSNQRDPQTTGMASQISTRLASKCHSLANTGRLTLGKPIKPASQQVRNHKDEKCAAAVARLANYMETFADFRKKREAAIALEFQQDVTELRDSYEARKANNKRMFDNEENAVGSCLSYHILMHLDRQRDASLAGNSETSCTTAPPSMLSTAGTAIAAC